MDETTLLARQHLTGLLLRIAESGDVQHYDEIGEATYAALFQLGVVEDTTDSNILGTEDEVAALDRLIDMLDQMFNVIGNCPAEEQNLKRNSWLQVTDQARAAYLILTALI